MSQLQIERFVRMGIPSSLRGRVWKCLLNTENMRESSVFNYQKCLDQIRGSLVELGVSEYSIISAIATLNDTENDLGYNRPACLPPNPAYSTADVTIFRQIALDLQRSFPTHRSLMGESPEAIEGQAKLFRVLIAYAKYNPEIGYSQGMSYIAAVLLMNLSEEEAFWALVVLLENPKYLTALFDLSGKKIQHQAMVFHQFLKHRQPQLSKHIGDVGVSSIHFVTPWFLTLFTSLPCWDSVLAIWDLFMLHGLSAVFRTGLTLIQLLESRLLSLTDEAAVLPLLLRVPVDVCQHNVLLPALWSTQVQDWEIKCMNSLVLEENDEGHHQGKTEWSTPLSPQPRPAKAKEPEACVDGPAPEAKKSGKKDSSATGPKNIFSRLVQVAQCLLLDKGHRSGRSKPSPARRRSSKASRTSSINQSQIRAKRRSLAQQGGGSLAEGGTTPTLVSEGSVKDSRPKAAVFRRMCSGPVGRVARRRSSSSQSPRIKSIGVLRPRTTQKPPEPPQNPSPCDPAQNLRKLERSSPSQPECSLNETANPARMTEESQLI
uniref:Rab-GAP TBC domain-containing protein n=1 Tax=Esox lucius TaxID=8010 RepID=A0A3P9A4Y9_ESOLU